MVVPGCLAPFRICPLRPLSRLQGSGTVNDKYGTRSRSNLLKKRAAVEGSTRLSPSLPPSPSRPPCCCSAAPWYERILERITREPGIRYSQLQRELELHIGALVHHLRALERGRLVTSRRDGPHRRFYAAGAAPRAVPVAAGPTEPSFTPMQRRVLDLLRHGPLTQREIAEKLGLTQQGANHHVKALERRGAVLLREETPGRWRVHRVVPMETLERRGP